MKTYESYTPNADGTINFSKSENETWMRLYNQQVDIVLGRACDEFISGLNELNLPSNRVPFPIEVTEVLQKVTGWTAEPVPAVIGPTKFFTLLANKKFPAATFIRNKKDFYYIKEPDIFHEIFGHCPLLTNEYYARFIEEYGKFALTCSKEERKYLFRLFWFTIEFGLIHTEEGDRIYGGGILSSIHETKTALNNPNVEYKEFDLLTIFRTPFRIDQPQKLYFFINSFEELFECFNSDIHYFINRARELGDIPPKFPMIDDKGDQLEYTN